MHIAIVGAGIQGLATANELAIDGHRVTVYEQRHAAGEGSSFAPGAWSHAALSPLLSTPSAAFTLEQLRTGHNPLLHGRAWPATATWRWLRQWQNNATHHHLHQTLQSLSTYSAQVRSQRRTPEAPPTPAPDALILLRTATDAHTLQHQLHPQPLLLDTAHVQSLEPGLSTHAPIQAALQLPAQPTFNARLWIQHLRSTAQERGVRLWTGATVQHIHTSPIAVQTQDQSVNYDAIVLCTGADTQLLGRLGTHLPCQPIWGYTVTAPLRDPLLAPRSTIWDAHSHIAVAQLGQRLRISAGACLGARSDPTYEQRTIAQMYAWLNELFPGAAQLNSTQVQIWRGVSAYLPDGLPAIGPTMHPGIWTNMAHGNLGASLASGCARLLADWMQGQPTALDTTPFHPLRFSKHQAPATIA